MQEVVFRVVGERPGHLEARSELPAIRGITAPTLEELQHEAREALIEHFGPVHCAYRVRIQRSRSLPGSRIQPLRRRPASCQ